VACGCGAPLRLPSPAPSIGATPGSTNRACPAEGQALSFSFLPYPCAPSSAGLSNRLRICRSAVRISRGAPFFPRRRSPASRYVVDWSSRRATSPSLRSGTYAGSVKGDWAYGDGTLSLTVSGSGATFVGTWSTEFPAAGRYFHGSASLIADGGTLSGTLASAAEDCGGYSSLSGTVSDGRRSISGLLEMTAPILHVPGYLPGGCAARQATFSVSR
jgi:hypothetical protein